MTKREIDALRRLVTFADMHAAETRYAKSVKQDVQTLRRWLEKNVPPLPKERP